MGDLKEKLLYYLEVYKKQIIMGGIILIFLIISILIYYLCFTNNKMDKNISEEIVIEEIKDIEDEIKNEEIKNEEVVINDTETNKEEIVKKVIVDIKGEVKKPGVYEVEENKRINDVIKMAGGLTKNASTLVNNLSRKVKDEMVIIIYSKTEIEDFKNKKEEENIILEEFDKVEDVIINDSVVDNSDIDSNTNIENSVNNENNKDDDSSNNNGDDNIDDNDKSDEDNKDIIDDGGDSDTTKISINTATKEQLMEIDGVGEKKAEAIIKYRSENGNFKTIEDIMNVSGIGESMFNKIKDKITI